MESDLDWLPERPDWQELLTAAKALGSDNLAEALGHFRTLARSRIDLALTVKLDRAVQSALGRVPETILRETGFTPVRLAVLGSSTVAHLVPGIRVAGLRRDLLIDIYQGDYGTWRQELADPNSGLQAFQPQILLLAVDAHHMTELEQTGGAGTALEVLRSAWRTSRERFGCAILQQTVLPVFLPVLGNAEHLNPESLAVMVERFNAELPQAAAQSNAVHLLSIHRLAAERGLAHWHSRALWFRAKQEVHPAMSPLYGDHVARIVAALLGQTAKCLVLDLDHTVWGGAIGEDGLEGILVSQGSAVGEAHLALQRYALALRERGILLAACSKNDEANALLPFEQHSDMVLRRRHFASFVANWHDKAANLRRIASELNLGLNAFVFVDDNAAERGLIRRELPEVHVPELPQDPADFVSTIASAGYFESVGITGEDRSRAELYRVTATPNEGGGTPERDGPTSLAAYLASLNMQLTAGPFDSQTHARVVQLINKTNQFNLTTGRVIDAEIARLALDHTGINLQLRLRDIYGDHGIIAVLIARPAHTYQGSFIEAREGDLIITHWLMSCRVLGREIEKATMNLVVELARAHGARRLFGLYLPSRTNGMVRDLYSRLGFSGVGEEQDGSTVWSLEVADYSARSAHIKVEAERLAAPAISS